MQGVRIFPITDSKINEKGISYSVENFSCDGMGIYFRKAGIVAGKHYHTGSNPLKNPERHILISGTAELLVKNLTTGESETTTLTSPIVWEVDAPLYHELKAITDCAYLEPRKNGIDPFNDTHYLE